MEESFNSRLVNKLSDSPDHICIGIDPHLGKVSGEFFMTQLETTTPDVFLQNMGQQLLEVASSERVSSVKFQSAFFEQAGEPGLRVLKQLLAEAKRKGLLTILDVKRGDISSTMQAYGHACFEELDADAMTVLPYMGLDTLDALAPWLQQGKGAYVVWISSNPGSEWLQGPLAETILTKLQEWLGKNELTGSCGLVLGATKLEGMAEHLYQRATGFPLLMPGIGAQGAQLGERAKRLDQDCPGYILPISRGISLFGLPTAQDTLNKCQSWDDYGLACKTNLDTIRELL